MDLLISFLVIRDIQQRLSLFMIMCDDLVVRAKHESYAYLRVIFHFFPLFSHGVTMYVYEAPA